VSAARGPSPARAALAPGTSRSVLGTSVSRVPFGPGPSPAPFGPGLSRAAHGPGPSPAPPPPDPSRLRASAAHERAPRLQGALAACLGLALGACNVAVGPKGVEATGTFLVPAPVVQDRPVADFARVFVDGALDVEVRVGSPCALRFEGDEERLAELSAEVRDGTLLVRADPGPPWRSGPRGFVTLPELASVTSAGSGWIAVTGLDQERLEVRVRGSGDVLLRGRVAELDAASEGVGRVDASGLSGTPYGVR